MNSNVLKWIKELEEGNVVQTTRALRRTHSFGGESMCALGVACQIYISETGKGRWEPMTPHYCDDKSMVRYKFISDSDQGERSVLPEEVMEYFGLKSPNPEVVLNNIPSNIMVMNDNDKLTFKEIAKALKETYEANR